MTKTITGIANQTIFDIALKHYGDTSGIDFLISDHDDIHNQITVEGETILIREDVINQRVVEYFSNQQIVTY